MLTAIVVLVFGAVIAMDFLPLNRIISLKEKWIYGIFILFSMCILILYTFDINLPSPSNLIISIVNTIIPTLRQ